MRFNCKGGASKRGGELFSTLIGMDRAPKMRTHKAALGELPLMAAGSHERPLH